MSSNCQFCPSTEAQMQVTDSAKGTSKSACLPCYFSALAPAGAPTPSGPVVPVAPKGVVVYASLDAAVARVEKHWLYLRQRPMTYQVEGGYALNWDSPLIPADAVSVPRTAGKRG